MKRLLIGCIAALAITTGYLGYRVFTLKRSLGRAEYFVQSGLISVQQTCSAVIEVIRAEALPQLELESLAIGCFGQTDGDAEVAELQAARRSPKRMADLIEQKLRVRRRLPWLSPSPASRAWMPVDYYNPTLPPDDYY